MHALFQELAVEVLRSNLDVIAHLDSYLQLPTTTDSTTETISSSTTETTINFSTKITTESTSDSIAQSIRRTTIASPTRIITAPFILVRRDRDNRGFSPVTPADGGNTGSTNPDRMDETPPTSDEGKNHVQDLSLPTYDGGDDFTQDRNPPTYDGAGYLQIQTQPSDYRDYYKYSHSKDMPFFRREADKLQSFGDSSDYGVVNPQYDYIYSSDNYYIYSSDMMTSTGEMIQKPETSPAEAVSTELVKLSAFLLNMHGVFRLISI